MKAAVSQRVSLSGLDWLTHYTLPLYLLAPSGGAAYCLLTNKYVPAALPVLTIMFLVTLPAAGFSAWYQTRALRFRVFQTSSDAHQNYEKVLHAMREVGWYVQHRRANRQIVASVEGLPISWGERVEVRFDDMNVLVNSICDPTRFRSITSWGRNGEHVRFIHRIVTDT